jgi:hypothetical protein
MAEADLVQRWEARREAEGRGIQQVQAAGDPAEGVRAVVAAAEERARGLLVGPDRAAEEREQGLVAGRGRAVAAAERGLVVGRDRAAVPAQGLAAGLDQAAERVLEAEPGAAAAVVRVDWELEAAEKQRGARLGSG